MRAVRGILLAVLVGAGTSHADIVKIETNTWSDPKQLTWSGTLEKIDGATGVAYFTYGNRGNIESFRVHVSRIYSLTLDEQSRVDRPFPRTMQDLILELPTNPRSSHRLELSNENYVTEHIPDDVHVRPNRDSLRIILSGRIMHADLGKMRLEARAQDKQNKTFDIDRSALLQWVR